MKTKKIALSFLLLVVFPAVLMAHQFYISITSIQHYPETEKLSVQVRLFINDLETAIFKEQGVRLGLGMNMPLENNKEHVEQYIRSKFSIAVNGSSVPLNYINHKAETAKIMEDQVIICHLEANDVPEIATIKVHNSLLTEAFDSQVNIVNISANATKKIINLDRKLPEDQVTFP